MCCISFTYYFAKIKCQKIFSSFVYCCISWFNLRKQQKDLHLFFCVQFVKRKHKKIILSFFSSFVFSFLVSRYFLYTWLWQHLFWMNWTFIGVSEAQQWWSILIILLPWVLLHRNQYMIRRVRAMENTNLRKTRFYIIYVFQVLPQFNLLFA